MPAATIFALSSGPPPSAIAIIRISGPGAAQAGVLLGAVAGPPRRARRARLVDPASGELLDHGLSLFFPAPASVTGESLLELHVHGGRAVVTGILAALRRIEGLREARPGEFTHQAFLNGKIDLTEVEGLADLLSAETAGQRRQALRIAEGGLSREVDRWRRIILGLSARVEAALDYADEDGAAADEDDVRAAIAAAAAELGDLLDRPSAERLRDGARIVLAGPPNAGKSSLFNALLGRDAALVSATPGTTRDVIEAAVQWGGIPLLLCDTAGLREGEDEIEAMGIDRALAVVQTADVVLWLGDAAHRPARDQVIQVNGKADLVETASGLGHDVSALTGQGVDDLKTAIARVASANMPGPDDVALNARQHMLLLACRAHLSDAAGQPDMVLMAEDLRQGLIVIDRLTGQAGTEEMLTELFSRFCLGK